MTPTRRRTLASRLRPGLLRFSAAYFLVTIALLFVATPFIERLPQGDRIEAGLLTLVLFSGVLAVGSRRSVLFWAVALAIPAVTTRWLNNISPALAPPELVRVAGLLFVAFIIVQMFRFILHAPRVNSEVLCAAIATYLMLALFWAFAYMLVADADAAAFAFTASRDSDQAMKGFTSLYFSFVTLTTVGYGDIAPVSGVARMLAAAEAIVGPLYLAILIARLVTMYSSESQAGAHPSL